MKLWQCAGALACAILAQGAAAQAYPAAGISWDYRNGVVSWASLGGDFGAAETSTSGGLGWRSWNVTSMVSDWHAGLFPNVGVFLTEADELAGGLHGYIASDDPDALRRPRLTVTYSTPTVDPVPRINGVIPNFSRPEDSAFWNLDLATNAQDEDTPLNNLRWNLSGYDSAVVSIAGMNTPGNHVLTFYPQKDAWRSMRVTYWLRDPDGNAASQAAWLNITPVNDPPAFNPPTTFVVRFNRTYTFDFSPYMTDVDDPLAGLVLLSDDTLHTAVIDHNVSFLYPESMVGSWSFVGLTLSDGKVSVTKVIAVSITSDTPPTLIKPLPDQTLMEGEFRSNVFDLDMYFTDEDNDALYFATGYTHLTITIRADHTVDMQAEAEWSGWERVTFRGQDQYGAIAEDTIIVTVIPVNDAPRIGPIPDLRVRYDEPYGFNVDPYLSDPDTPADQLNLSTSSPFVTVSAW